MPALSVRWRTVRAACIAVFTGALLFASAAWADDPVVEAVDWLWSSRLTVFGATGLVVVICIALHYEALGYLTSRLKNLELPLRARILVLIVSIVLIHVVQVWIFGGAYYFLVVVGGHGALVANHVIGLLDCVYFSTVSFTTLGLGDIVPTGDIRFLVGTEALVGFVLITWSASFTFVEMQRYWKT